MTDPARALLSAASVLTQRRPPQQSETDAYEALRAYAASWIGEHQIPLDERRRLILLREGFVQVLRDGPPASEDETASQTRPRAAARVKGLPPFRTALRSVIAFLTKNSDKDPAFGKALETLKAIQARLG